MQASRKLTSTPSRVAGQRSPAIPAPPRLCPPNPQGASPFPPFANTPLGPRTGRNPRQARGLGCCWLQALFAWGCTTPSSLVLLPYFPPNNCRSCRRDFPSCRFARSSEPRRGLALFVSRLPLAGRKKGVFSVCAVGRMELAVGCGASVRCAAPMVGGESRLVLMGGWLAARWTVPWCHHRAVLDMFCCCSSENRIAAYFLGGNASYL